MGAAGCQPERCAPCCSQADAKVQDIVALKPSAAPGLDTVRKPTTQKPEPGLPATPRGAAEASDNNPAAVGTEEEFTPNRGDVHETYDDGSTYDGQILEGERHGRGIWKSPTESYVGDWSRDNRHGQGKQTWDDGRSYEGHFRLGKFHGAGKMVWSTPQGAMSYEGEYCDDLKHGDGTYNWPDGRVYDGQWVQGMRSGTAILINPRGDRRQGVWKDDKFDKWIENGGNSAPPTPR